MKKSKTKKPSVIEGLVLLGILIYFFTKSMPLFILIVVGGLIVKQIYNDGYTINNVDKWIKHYITSFQKDMLKKNN
jgi:uncharacterized membrane protein YqgA involved in biofilm formation